MAKKKITRKELLKGPDEFLTLSGRTLEFMSNYRQQLRYAGLAIAAVVIGYFAIHAWTGHINEEGQNAYNTAANAVLSAVMTPDADLASLKKSGDLFAKVIDEHGMSKAAHLAVPQAAYLRFLEKDYPKAIELYEEFLDEVSGNPQYEALTSLALAACYEAKGDFKTAIKTLNPLVKTASHNPFRESAMWSLARLYRLDNDSEKAVEILKEFVEKFEGSPYHAMAKAFL